MEWDVVMVFYYPEVVSGLPVFLTGLPSDLVLSDSSQMPLHVEVVDATSYGVVINGGPLVDLSTLNTVDGFFPANPNVPVSFNLRDIPGYTPSAGDTIEVVATNANGSSTSNTLTLGIHYEFKEQDERVVAAHLRDLKADYFKVFDPGNVGRQVEPVQVVVLDLQGVSTAVDFEPRVDFVMGLFRDHYNDELNVWFLGSPLLTWTYERVAVPVTFNDLMTQQDTQTYVTSGGGTVGNPLLWAEDWYESVSAATDRNRKRVYIANLGPAWDDGAAGGAPIVRTFGGSVSTPDTLAGNRSATMIQTRVTSEVWDGVFGGPAIAYRTSTGTGAASANQANIETSVYDGVNVFFHEMGHVMGNGDTVTGHGAGSAGTIRGGKWDVNAPPYEITGIADSGDQDRTSLNNNELDLTSALAAYSSSSYQGYLGEATGKSLRAVVSGFGTEPFGSSCLYFDDTQFDNFVMGPNGYWVWHAQFHIQTNWDTTITAGDISGIDPIGHNIVHAIVMNSSFFQGSGLDGTIAHRDFGPYNGRKSVAIPKYVKTTDRTANGFPANQHYLVYEVEMELRDEDLGAAADPANGDWWYGFEALMVDGSSVDLFSMTNSTFWNNC